MSKVKLSVVVCVYNREDLLYDALKSLLNQTLSKEFYEVLIIDNNSKDRSFEIGKEFCEKYDNFKILKEQKQGLSFARNKGLKEATGKYISYIDDDAKADPDWLEKIVSTFEKEDPGIVAVGGEIYPWFEVDPPSWVKELEIRSWGEKKGILETFNARYGFSGSNMSFPVDILKKYGGFSSHFGMIGSKMRMGEESHLFSTIYDDTPFFWYDPSIRVKHWVPKKNMSVLYRFKRSFSAGKSKAMIDKKTIFPIRNYIKELTNYFGFILKISITVIKSDSSVEKVRLVQRAGHRSGYLIRKWK